MHALLTFHATCGVDAKLCHLQRAPPCVIGSPERFAAIKLGVLYVRQGLYRGWLELLRSQLVPTQSASSATKAVSESYREPAIVCQRATISAQCDFSHRCHTM